MPSGVYKRTEETKKKLRKAKTGKNHPMYGKHHSKETKKKISEGNRGKVVSEETKKKIGDGNRGKHHRLTEETKKKMSDAHRGKRYKISNIDKELEKILETNELKNMLKFKKETGKNAIYRGKITGQFKYWLYRLKTNSKLN